MTAKITVNSSDNPKSQPAKETVYVDVEDEITSIIGKVEGAKAKLVALVLPKRASALQSVVNMRLLKRRADSSAKSVVLITTEAALLPLAGAAGLHVAKNLQSTPEVPPSPLEAAALESTTAISTDESGEDEELDGGKPAKIDYNRSIGELAAAHEVEEPEVIALDDDEDLPEPNAPKSSAPKQAKSRALKGPKVPNFDKFRLVLFGGIAAFIALIVFIFLAIFVLPKATITIDTASSPVSANLNLNASDKYTALNETASQIPASLKASNQTAQQTVTATGQQNQGNKATVTVTLTNCTATSTSVTVPAGTGVSNNGLTFITQKSVTLPNSYFSAGKCKNLADSYQDVPAIASSGGTKYNDISSGSTFGVSGFSATQSNGYPSIQGVSSAKSGGGTDNNVTVVSQSDVDSAKAKATSTNSNDYTNTFIKQLEGSGLYVLRSTLKAGDPAVTANPAVGTQAANTTVSIQVTYSVLTLKKADLTKAITDTLNEQIDKSRQKLSTTDVLSGVSVTIQNQTADAAATLNVNETTTAVPIIDVASVKKLAVGKKTHDIQLPISNWPGVKSVDVHMSPFWVSKAPKQSKITVVLKQVKN